MRAIADYREIFISALQKEIQVREPRNLYEPIEYILSLGGKRTRPVLTLLSAEIFGSDCRAAVPAAIAVEVFHNFSLVHDDIMDEAPLRRGKETVHEKWDTNTAILSGDAMLILAYQYFEQYDGDVFKELARLFSRTALQVCEGQQLDVDFENRDDVTLQEYLKMIEYKTAVLIAAALQMGAIVAKTSVENCRKIYEFGLYLGIAFQIQDDYLDAFGDPETFGKQVGGDIIENKKTFLFLKAIEFSSVQDAEQLKHLFSIKPNDNSQKISSAKAIFDQSGASESARQTIESYTLKALHTLESIDLPADKINILREFAQTLMKRNT